MEREFSGEGNDDHPHADIRAGDAFLAKTFAAVSQSPLWPRTAFVVTYDEWGGFFDHVVPPRVIAGNLVDPHLRRQDFARLSHSGVRCVAVQSQSAR